MDYIIQKTERKVKLRKRKSPKPLSIKAIHNEKCKYFNELQEKILPYKIKELESLENKSDIIKIKNEIKKIKDREEELDYYFNTAHILDKYFLLDDGVENEKDGDYTKMDLVREYYEKVNMDLPKEYSPDLTIDYTQCKLCNSKNSTIASNESTLVCTVCGYINPIMFLSDTLSYKDKQDTEIIVVLDYKRVDYFKQWLNQIQAKEQTEIPQEVIDNIILQIKTERIKNISKISISTMKRLLKKTNNSKYYEHIPYITNCINKIPPLNIPSYIEDKLVAMFEEIQIPWEELKTKDRKNFFSYPYTLHKFCQILNLNEYLPYFPLLKCREKLYKQDIIWKKIIEYLNHNPSKNNILKDVEWIYISSI